MEALDPRLWLKRLKYNESIWPLLAFGIPFALRLLPEILAWPYPLGFDTLIYADQMLEGRYLTLSLAELLSSTSLLWFLATAVGRLVGDVVLAVKVLGPVLFSLLSWLMYPYARRVLKWGKEKALLASVLVGTYFVSLRVSWEMYRQMLGFIFLMVGLTGLRLANVKWRRVVVAVAGFLAVWSHESAAVLFFGIVGTHILVNRDARLRSKMDLAFVGMPALLLFLFQSYNPVSGSLIVPYESVASTSPLATASYISGFLGYLFLPLLPLAVVGACSLREWDVWSWLMFCLVFSYWPVFLPEYAVLYWFRWSILLVYPLAFFAVEGVWGLWRRGRVLVWRMNVGKMIVVSLLVLNVVMSSYYVLSLPEHQIKYFGEWNPYTQYLQSSMLQNSVSLSDTPHVVEALKWLEGEMQGTDSVLILHEAMDNWARILLPGKETIRVKEITLSSQVRENVATSLAQLAEERVENLSTVYTVWWVDGKGWYNMPAPPSGFQEIQRFQTIGVYQYVSTRQP